MEDNAPVATLWQADEAAYKRARRLEHPAGLDPLALCDSVLDRAAPGWQTRANDETRDLLADAEAAKSDLGIFALNLSARLALSQGAWDKALSLAQEVTARDHHDLLAQRIADAAEARSETLVTETETWLADRFCPAPFEEMETRENGDIHFCCSAWQPAPIGRLDDDDQDPWHSKRATEIRRSVTQGDFSRCSRWHCPRIADRRLPRRHPDDLARPVPDGPRRVILSHDRSCNLACPSCRTSMISADRAATSRLDRLYETKLRKLADRADTVKVTGSGDPFGSRHFRKIVGQIAAQPGRRLQLQTNGLLLDERAWNDLDLWGSVRSVWVSADAARATTYTKLRGGDFERLRDNLEFLGMLRRLGELPFLRLDMVVQRDNFEEMGEFTDLARRVGADGIYLLRLRNWGTFSTTAFRALDVCRTDHPDHAHFLDRLADPRLGTTDVELGSLAPFRRGL